MEGKPRFQRLVVEYEEYQDRKCPLYAGYGGCQMLTRISGRGVQPGPVRKGESLAWGAEYD